MLRPALFALAALASQPALASPADPYPSTYQPIRSTSVLIINATVLTGTGARIDDADIYIENGRIARIGTDIGATPKAVVVDAQGKWVTPGLIDVHSHLGVYPSPALEAHSDGNEMTAPVTANVWAEHSVWPQDPGFHTALAGGVTTLQILPGSANLIGGRSVVLRNLPATTYQAMKFPGAAQGLKMACGENPKRTYGSEQGVAPSTRMGNVAGYRAAFAEAREYQRAWDKYEREGRKGDAPKFDLRLDTLAATMRGEIPVHIHCYRSDEMAIMMDLAREFGFRIAAFHHGVEAYKLADRLAAENICGALWADWWGFKLEAWDAIEENIAVVDRPQNGCAIVHSDSEEGIQRLNQEAAKVIASAARIGWQIPPERAIRWLTSNAARSLHIQDQTGTLEVGKRADVVVWNQNPFSVYAHAERVYLDGALVYERGNPAVQPVSDFMLGAGVSP